MMLTDLTGTVTGRQSFFLGEPTQDLLVVKVQFQLEVDI
jgi:hypothetical protein